jgi:hypothetical protein
MSACVICGNAATVGLVLVLQRSDASGDYNAPWLSCDVCLPKVREGIERMREDSLRQSIVPITLTLEERPAPRDS